MRAQHVAGSLLVMLPSGCTTPSGAPDYTGTGALIGGVSGGGVGRRHRP